MAPTDAGSRTSRAPSQAGRGQLAAAVVSVMLGLAVAGYGIAGSYETLSELAARKGLPLPGLVPLGIDGGFVGVVALDLVLTWAGQPIGWLRQVARALTVGTVAANAAAGWPDPVAVGLHTAAPAMLLVMVEAARAVLLRRMGRANGTARDSIPLLRWVLAPWRTCLLWRRMVLWQVASYRQAVEAELELRRATTLLRDRFGRRWRRAAPTDLVWMLQTGVSAFEACGRVRELVTGCDQGLGGGDAENSGLNHHPAIEVSDPMAMGHRGDGSMRDERFQDAVRLNADHWARWGRPISAESLRKELRIGASKARALARAARAADAAAIRAAAPITPT